MDYEKKYKELIEKLQTAKEKSGGYTFASVIDAILPELVESEDEKIRKEIIQSIQDNMSVIHKDKCIAWLEKQGEQNHAWSEEDEKKIMWLVRLISTAGYRELDNDKMPCSRSELLDWLKSLKDRVQLKPKQEWSEEDEAFLGDAIYAAENTYSENCGQEELIDWLKSLKLQNHWKPSEEQLEALWNAIPHIPNSEKELDTITELSALYEELKSL